MTCPKCNNPLAIGDFPFCPHGPSARFSVIGDDIPGGLMVPHGICHADGTPKRYDSKSEIRRALRAKGLCIEGETPK
jgi:hypothetical protein